ncbi:MAG: thioredoxin [Anaerolineae bacterium]|nr:thioredoxin [Anaerolineae bacterium]
MSDAVKHVSDAEFEAQVIKSKLPVVVDFWASWCGPCRMLAPAVEELAQEYQGKVVFAKMNTDENPVTPGQYNIMSIPTLLFFKDGELVERSIGLKAKPALSKLVDDKLLS